MKTFTTPKGTELPFLNLKGKDYLQVMHRLQWFREEHPTWNVASFIVEHSEHYAIFRTTISDENQKPVAQAHGREDQKHFQDYIEKAETKSVGRALALCGYGTQFAQELEEDHRLVYSPAPVRPAAQAATVGKPTPVQKSSTATATGTTKKATTSASTAASPAFRDSPIPVGVFDDSTVLITKIQKLVGTKHIPIPRVTEIIEMNWAPAKMLKDLDAKQLTKLHDTLAVM